MRFLTAGESHGPALTAIVEGFPAGVPIAKKAIDGELARRQRVAGRGARSTRIEADEVEILSGVRGGLSLGSPIALQIKNRDWPHWEPYLSPAGEVKRGRELVCPRPGHADLAGGQKYGFADLRNVLERASARSTAARTAVGALARQLLAQLGVRITGYVASIGTVRLPAERVAEAAVEEIARRAAASPCSPPTRRRRPPCSRLSPPLKKPVTLWGDFRGVGFWPAARAGQPRGVGPAPGRAPRPGPPLHPCGQRHGHR